MQKDMLQQHILIKKWLLLKCCFSEKVSFLMFCDSHGLLVTSHKQIQFPTFATLQTWICLLQMTQKHEAASYWAWKQWRLRQGVIITQVSNGLQGVRGHYPQASLLRCLEWIEMWNSQGLMQRNASLKVTFILRHRMGHAFHLDFTATQANPNNQEFEANQVWASHTNQWERHFC